MDIWYKNLQELFKQAIERSTSPDWLKENSYISSDIWDREGIFEVERLEYGENELHIYARLGQSITSVHDIRPVIYEVLRSAVEDFFVLVPLHTPNEWQFWFMTGYESHGHIAKIIIEREKHPHIQG